MVITEKTNFAMSLATLVTVIIFLVVATYNLTLWKTDIEHKIDTNAKSIEINAANNVNLYNVQKRVIEVQTMHDIKFERVLTNQENMEKKLDRLLN